MSGGTDTCPLCGFTGDTRTDVYTHVQTSHRKSAITDALLETQRPRVVQE